MVGPSVKALMAKVFDWVLQMKKGSE